MKKEIKEHQTKKPSVINKSTVKEFIETIVFVITALIIIRFYAGEIRWIPSASMKPSFIEGDRVLVERFTRFFKAPERGDIMVFYPPSEDIKADPWSVFTRLTGIACRDIAYIKRVIGLPGEKIEIKEAEDGSFDVYINDKPLNEPYIMDRFEYPPCNGNIICGPVILGGDEYFMLGDNRGHSADSRYWGALKRERFIGKAKVLFWPFNHFQYFGKMNY